VLSRVFRGDNEQVMARVFRGDNEQVMARVFRGDNEQVMARVFRGDNGLEGGNCVYQKLAIRVWGEGRTEERGEARQLE